MSLHFCNKLLIIYLLNETIFIGERYINVLFQFTSLVVYSHEIFEAQGYYEQTEIVNVISVCGHVICDQGIVNKLHINTGHYFM